MMTSIIVNTASAAAAVAASSSENGFKVLDQEKEMLESV